MARVVPLALLAISLLIVHKLDPKLFQLGFAAVKLMIVPLEPRVRGLDESTRRFWMTCVPLTPTVPPIIGMVVVPIFKVSEVAVVGLLGVPVPALEVDKKLSVPHVPLAVPKPEVVLLQSQ